MVYSSRACYATCICLAACALFPTDSRPTPQAKPAPIEVRKFVIRDNPVQFSQPVRRGKYIEAAGRRAVLMGREE